MPAVEVENLRKEFVRKDGPPPRRRRRVGAQRRLLRDRARRVRRDPRPERLGQVDAGPAALDVAPARRRRGARSSATTRSRRREPCAGSSTASRSRRASSRRCPRREPRLRGALLRDDAGQTRERDPADPRARRLPADRRRADGEPVPRHAAEGRARPRAAHVARPAAARRADDRPRPALEARGAGVHPRGPGDPRRDDLLCTHDLAEAETLADRVGILDRGALLCARARRRAQGSGTARRRSRRRSSPRPAAHSRTRPRRTRTGGDSHDGAAAAAPARADRPRRRRRAQRGTSSSATSGGSVAFFVWTVANTLTIVFIAEGVEAARRPERRRTR